MAQMDGAFVVSQSVSQSCNALTALPMREIRASTLSLLSSRSHLFFFGVIDQRTIHTKPARYDVVVDVDGPRSHVS